MAINIRRVVTGHDADGKAVASGKPAVVDVVSDINGIAPRAWTPS